MTEVSGRNESSAAFDSNPGFAEKMPARPYRVLLINLPFYSDPECKSQVEGSRLILLKSEDPKQNHQVEEWMPTRMQYQVGQIVQWGLNNKNIWQESWFKNPETGKIEKAWNQAVEFNGKIVRN
jgi:hypothetical protein